MEPEDIHQEFKIESKSAFDGRVRSYRIELCDIEQSSRENNKDKVQAVLNETRNTIANKLEEALNEHDTIQATLNLEGSQDEYDYKTFSFNAMKMLNSINSELSIQKFLQTTEDQILSKFYDYDSHNKGSMHFHYLYLFIHKVAVQDCMTNVKSDDDMSFKWEVLKALHPGKNTPDELTKFSDDLIMDGIDYPVQLEDMPMIEENNKFSINVYMLKYSFYSNSYETEGPVYHTMKRQEQHINLLLCNKNGRNRYSYIKDLSSSNAHNFCDGCFNSFDKKENFERHQREECFKVKTKFPKDAKVKFSDQGYSEKLPFVVYAHFETLSQIVESAEEVQERQSNNVWIAHTHKHLPYSYGYYIKCVDDEFSTSKVDCFEQKNLHACVRSFTDNLVNDLRQKWSNYKSKHPEAYMKHIPVIMQKLESNGNYFVQQSNCSSFFIRMKRYLAILKKLDIGDGANNINIRFLDFNNFINEPLKNAVKSLDKKDFKKMQGLVDESKDVNRLIERKIIFPGKYVSKSLDNLMKISLPTEDDDINDGELHSHALGVWEHFHCSNIRDYLIIYIKSNIFLLASVIENLRNFCSQHYNLDLAHYYSISGFSWDAMLKMTKIELELFTDVEMLNFIKKGIRGGYVQCNKRHAVANNKYLPGYNQNEEESYIMFLDANNLYGHIMCQHLPYGGFEWVDVDYDYKTPNPDFGYILEVDLSYPVDLHDKHSDLPFCPVKRNVNGADNEFLVADFHQKTRYVIHHSCLALCVKEGLNIERIHRILKFKQKAWLKDYIEFNTSKRQAAKSKCDQNFFKLLNNCIYGKTMENLDNRSVVQLFHHFDNKGFKAGASSSIGRPDRSSYAICSESTVAINFKKTNILYNKPIYVGFCILDLAKTEMCKFHYNFMKKEIGNNLRLLYTDTDSLIYEFTGLDIYEFIKKHINSNKLQELGTGFDTSGYKSNNEFGIPERNHKKPGYFKDELNGAVVKEFIGLRSKVFLIDYVAEHALRTIKKAVMVPKRIKETFQTNDYRNCVSNNELLYKEYSRERSVDFDVYTQYIRRMVLSPNDHKRYLVQENQESEKRVDTLPWGHYKIQTVDVDG